MEAKIGLYLKNYLLDNGGCMLKKIMILLLITNFNIICKNYNLKGTISNFPITMKLTINQNNANGSYYHDKYKVPIFLTGTLENNILTLGENNAEFKGVLFNDSYEGNWSNGEGKKQVFKVKIWLDDEFIPENYYKVNKGVEAKINYYKCNNNEVSNLFNNFLLSTILDKDYINVEQSKNNDISSRIKEFHENFAQSYFEENKNNSSQPWKYNKEVKLSYNDFYFSSIYTEGSSFTGGSREYGVINTILLYKGEKTKQIILQDILVKNYEKTLKSILLTKYSFLKDDENDFFSTLGKKFFIDNEGFVFIYDPFNYGYLEEEIRIDYKEIPKNLYLKNSVFFKYIINPRLY